MARPQKNREVSIVHFSFFDLLFGAFGAFVFLMIMQVLSTLNLVDVDIQKLVDNTVQEKVALTKELEKYKETDQLLNNLQRQHDQLIDERKKLIQEREQLSQQNGKLEADLSASRRELESLNKFKKELRQKGDVVKVLEQENKKLANSLDAAKKKLAAVKTVPLRIKTESFPTTITEEKVMLSLAAEGGSPPYTWELDGRLPKGLAFNQSTGSISGIVGSDGEFNFKVKVTDARGLSVKTENDILLKVIRKFEQQKKKVSPLFLIMTVISSLLLLYILWGKYKIRKHVREMRKKGFEPVWVKK